MTFWVRRRLNFHDSSPRIIRVSCSWCTRYALSDKSFYRCYNKLFLPRILNFDPEKWMSRLGKTPKGSAEFSQVTTTFYTVALRSSSSSSLGLIGRYWLSVELSWSLVNGWCSSIKIMYTMAPSIPPSEQATTGTQAQWLAAVNTSAPHPAMAVNTLGPRSLAGFMA